MHVHWLFELLWLFESTPARTAPRRSDAAPLPIQRAATRAKAVKSCMLPAFKIRAGDRGGWAGGAGGCRQVGSVEKGWKVSGRVLVRSGSIGI